ncbi:MAG: hypothetical protein M0Z43_03075 [Acidithiobacillus sp.]|nr:hypothetical protein [Acidithiobacillus sp.]
MTAQSGPVLSGEFAQGSDLHRWLKREMPKPGGGHAYTATEHVLPLIRMLTGGADLWKICA